MTGASKPGTSCAWVKRPPYTTQLHDWYCDACVTSSCACASFQVTWPTRGSSCEDLTSWIFTIMHMAKSKVCMRHSQGSTTCSCGVWCLFTLLLMIRRIVRLRRLVCGGLNPKTAGGGGGGDEPPPRHFAQPFRRANFFDRAAHWLFTFKSRASYDTIFAKIGHTVTMLHNLLYMLVRPKMAQKRDFVYKVNVNGVFSPYS